ncbi:MAG: hypothetical protein IPG56_19480 [Caulobacteraceae bacterium]|nr:hypothetical protein [Caulobacteraceae bacterium]
MLIELAEGHVSRQMRSSGHPCATPTFVSWKETVARIELVGVCKFNPQRARKQINESHVVCLLADKLNNVAPAAPA